jgi:NAD(P)-dependent dehydrogenase (short-subunit alcohol dehydrogenase family)
LDALTPGTARGLWGDLAFGKKTADALAASVRQKVTHLDLLVLNAGYFVEGTLLQLPDKDFQRNLTVNFLANHYLIRALLARLKAAPHARIVIIGSTAAYEPYPLVPSYGVAKWALRGYAINLRRELAPQGIAVTFLSPGATLTDMWKGVELPPDRLLRPSDIGLLVEAITRLSPQAVPEELVIRSMLGDIHE